MDNRFSCIPQHATADPKTHTPLWNREPIQSSDIRLEERPFLGHFNLRMEPQSNDRPAAEALLGVKLPDTPLSSNSSGHLSVYWMAPDDWLVLMPFEVAASFEAEFRAAMQGHYSIVDVSGGQTVIRLAGSAAREVLQKSTMIDVHPDQFPVGKFAATSFAKSAANIIRVDDETYDLIVRRSFADYIWEWLCDATLAYR
jgi:sarcosine oxidase, subunit gamma